MSEKYENHYIQNKIDEKEDLNNFRQKVVGNLRIELHNNKNKLEYNVKNDESNEEKVEDSLEDEFSMRSEDLHNEEIKMLQEQIDYLHY